MPDEKQDAVVPYSLLSLRPKAQPEHSTYVKFLASALKDESVDAPKNIALSGGYGTGKSSILEETAATFKPRVVRVSFSTLGASREKRQGDDREETELDSVQKEIVKQILYTSVPGGVPASRFRRLDSFHWARAIFISATVATLIAIVVYTTGVARRLEDVAAAGDLKWWAGYVIAIGLITIAATAIQYILQTVRIGKVSTANSSIELAESSTSYFDQYLDEIVYFFQQSGRDIVLLEDLDRFESSSVFEELRELNTLLNGAKQIGHPVKFVYAVKDALFESWPAGDPADLTQSAAVRRTKFFDLVIPVVPFIGQRSAREYLSELAEGAHIELPDRLIALVARRLPEMRLLKNIVNEYSVFAEVAAADGTQGFDNAAERFAMVVFKNVRPKDFEAIHFGNASLNRVYESYRRIIVAETNRLEEELAELGKVSALTDAAKSLAMESGREAVAYVSRILSVTFNPGTTFTYTVGGTSYSAAQIGEPTFWDSLYASADKVMHVEANGAPAGVFRLDDLKRELDLPASGAGWNVEGRKRLQQQRSEVADLLATVRRATFASLIARPDLLDPQTTQPLATLVTRELEEGTLALDLVTAGFIDQHFNLYVTRFKGLQLTKEAATYLIQTIEPLKYDPEYELGSATAVEALIEQAGGEFLGEASALNIDIFDAMLGQASLKAAIRRLADASSTDPFISLYLDKGKKADLLIQQLAPFWPGLFRVAVEESTGVLQRDAVLRIAIENADPEVRYEKSDRISTQLSSDLPSLTVDLEPSFAYEDLGTILARLDVHAANLLALPSRLGRRLAELGNYQMTEANLQFAADGSSISLEDLQGTPAFAKVTSDLAGYLSLARTTGNPTLRDLDRLPEVLKHLADAGITDVQGLLEQADPSIFVSSWTQIAEPQRPSAVASKRIASDFDLIEDYITDFGLDVPMAHFIEAIRDMPQLSDTDPPQSRRRAIAVRILNSSIDLQPSLRAVKSLQLEAPVEVESLTIDDPDNVAAYLDAGVLADDRTTWEALAGRAWPVKQAFLEHSETVERWADLTTFSDSDLESLFASDSKDLEGIKRVAFEMLGSASLSADSWNDLLDFSTGADLLMKDDVLAHAASSGADRIRVLDAFVKVDRVLPVIQSILDELGGEYATVARAGHGQHKFPRDSTHRALGEMLARAEIVNVDETDDFLKFNLRHPQ